MTSPLQLRSMLAVDRAKTAFSTNSYSGPMNPTIRSGASYLPPATAPSLGAPAQKTSALYKLEGDGVIEVGKDGKSLGKGNVLEEKSAALGGKLLRLAATDVPNTPRMLMRQRSPEELAGIEHSYDDLVTAIHGPVKRAVEPAIQKLPAGRTQDYLRKGIHTLIENPEGIVAWGSGIPGALEGYVGGKKLLEKGIDRFAPAAPRAHLPTILPPMPTKVAAGAPTRGGFMMASDIPPMRAPSLRTPVEKLSDALPDNVTYNPGDFKKAKLSAGQNESIDENATSAPEDGKKIGSVMAAVLHAFDRYMGKTADLLDSDWGADTGDPVDQKNYLKGKEKDSSMGTSPMQAAMTAKTVGTFKMGKIPGPSIADVAKPKGAGFGTGIAGAFKSTIGGAAPVSLSASPGSPK